jgi:hypothetical protein
VTKDERFGLHGLKHRGVTDTKGDKKLVRLRDRRDAESAMLNLYNHELPPVDSTAA